jgi:hypothetical protein
MPGGTREDRCVTRHADLALPARRAYVVDNDQLRAVVVEIDATANEPALAVLQAGLAEYAEGMRLVHGYRVSAAGLGAWIGDRRLRVVVWPALIDDAGEITEDDPDDPETDVLVVDIDPQRHGDALDALADLGRLVIAGPDAGPVPLVLDVDRDLVAEVLADVRA